MDDGSGVDDECELLQNHISPRPLNANAGHAGPPCWHRAFLTKGRRYAEAGILRHRAAPACFLCCTLDDRGLAQCAADRVRRRARIPAGAVKQAEAEPDRIDTRRVSRFVHEAFHRPIVPTAPDPAEITRAEGAVRAIV